jgi:hypothetical protein
LSFSVSITIVEKILLQNKINDLKEKNDHLLLIGQENSIKETMNKNTNLIDPSGEKLKKQLQQKVLEIEKYKKQLQSNFDMKTQINSLTRTNTKLDAQVKTFKHQKEILEETLFKKEIEYARLDAEKNILESNRAKLLQNIENNDKTKDELNLMKEKLDQVEMKEYEKANKTILERVEEFLLEIKAHEKCFEEKNMNNDMKQLKIENDCLNESQNKLLEQVQEIIHNRIELEKKVKVFLKNKSQKMIQVKKKHRGRKKNISDEQSSSNSVKDNEQNQNFVKILRENQNSNNDKKIADSEKHVLNHEYDSEEISSSEIKYVSIIESQNVEHEKYSKMSTRLTSSMKSNEEIEQIFEKQQTLNLNIVNEDETFSPNLQKIRKSSISSKKTNNEIIKICDEQNKLNSNVDLHLKEELQKFQFEETLCRAIYYCDKEIKNIEEMQRCNADENNDHNFLQ